MKVGILTGGGDAPGLNGIISASTQVLLKNGIEVIGIRDGFEGVFKGETVALTQNLISGIHKSAGTILGTSNRGAINGREQEFLKKFKSLKLQALIVAGGDGTFRALHPLRNEIAICGVPKTIDNDLSGTEITFGFDTASSVVADAVNDLRATAEAHQRILFVETMGRNAGWIALGGGLAARADAILIPERPIPFSKFLKFLSSRRKSKRSFVCVVSEGAFVQGEKPKVALRVKGSPEEIRFGGIAESLARKCEAALDWESRHIVLGHLQRSRSPTATDCFLTLGMGVAAAEMVLEKDFGRAAVYRNGRVVRAPLEDLMGPTRRIDLNHHWIQWAQKLGIYI